MQGPPTSRPTRALCERHPKRKKAGEYSPALSFVTAPFYCGGVVDVVDCVVVVVFA